MATTLNGKLLFFTIALIAIAVNFISAELNPVLAADETALGRECKSYQYFLNDIPGRTHHDCLHPYTCIPNVNLDDPAKFDCGTETEVTADKQGNDADRLQVCRGTCQREILGGSPASPSNGLSATALVGAGLVIMLLIAGYSVMRGKPKK